VTPVDVVIPAYNAQAFLGEALDSVLSQGPSLGKVVVVDDGSDDETAALATARGTPVEVVRLPRNRGIAAARNAGLALCDAEYIAFLDADDRWLPGKLEAQVAALARAHDRAFALCRVRPFADAALPDAERAALLAQQPAEMEGWMASALLARRSLFAHVGGFAEDLRVGEAIDWFSRVRAFGHVVIPEVLVERRMHRRNTTRLAREQSRDYLLAAHRHLTRQRTAGGGG
jgi:glycosyltransferase involved in cell wall biosynthesis